MSEPQTIEKEPTNEGQSRRLAIRERYGFILLLILFGYVLTGIDDSRFVHAVNSVIWVGVVFTALWSPGIPTRLRRVGLGALAVVLASSISLGLVDATVPSGWRSILLALAQLAAIVAILRRILRHETVSLQTVMGGVAAYALIAFALSSIYQGVDLLTESAFLNGIVDSGDYTYFSFVTLTTVGYGDLTAASALAKRLVVIEAFVGQVFIITLVARLVSLWGQPLRRRS